MTIPIEHNRLDRPKGGERAILVHINFPADKMREDLNEFEELAQSAGADVTAIITGTRGVPDPKLFIGSGKANEVKTAISATSAQLVIFNHTLSPSQERNLEKYFQCRVVDRTGLILDIFAQRARSFEGKLQVELAFLKHISTRLVRGWTHLERQRGGIGLRGGPGETQLELDRRLIRTRMQYIDKRLLKVRSQRSQGRRARKRAAVPTIALVGYTNAGKSTLFNRLTGSEVYVANKLFATLDPTLRRIDLPEIGETILADTVGFIRHLPHELVAAFHATLEEVAEADLLLHVVDIHDERRQANIDQVNAVLESIGANNVPQLIVYNKIDLAGLESSIERVGKKPVRVLISSRAGQGLNFLIQGINELLGKDLVHKKLILTPDKSKIRALLYKKGAVISESIDEEGKYHLQVRMQKQELKKLLMGVSS